MKKQMWLSAFFILFLASADAYAAKTCWCWIGPKGGNGWVSQGDPVKWKDFGGIDSYGNFVPNKVQKCSQSCATVAANSGLLSDNQTLCNLVNRPVSSAEAATIGVYSIVGAGDWGNNVWDADGVPTNFKGCTRKCTCPKSWYWYDENRRSCVTGAPCDKVPGMPDGDKGGGYWAWQGLLFIDIAGGNCILSPIP